MSSPLPPDNRKVVFITGCSSGIGRALAVDFAERPSSRLHHRDDQISLKRYRVFAGVRNLESVRDLNPHIERVRIDVNDDESVKTAVESIIKEVGKIDILINNAGVNAATGATVEIGLDKIRATFETNFFGLLRVTQAVSKHMIPRQTGTIINIGSIVAYGNYPWSAGYSCSKAAVHSLNDVLRSELSPFGIRVLLIAPGAIKSSFGDNATKGIEFPDKSSPFAAANEALKYRATVSQQGTPTPAAEFAKLVRHETERSVWRQSHYRTLGKKGFFGWLLYYMPPFLRDFFIWHVFKLGTIKPKLSKKHT